jgi:hypothetical protein
VQRNVLDNASFEERPFGLRATLRDSLSQVIGRPFDTVVTRLSDTLSEPRTAEELRLEVIEPFLVTLWGRPGRTAELNLPTWWYTSHLAIGVAAVVGLLVGAGVKLAQRRVSAIDVTVAGLLLVALLGAMIVTLGPYVIGLFSGPPFGRYLLPALVPLSAGYAFGLVGTLPRPWRLTAGLLVLVVLAALDTYAVISFLPNHFAIRPPLPG